jgi:hypothetical protein
MQGVLVFSGIEVEFSQGFQTVGGLSQGLCAHLIIIFFGAIKQT